MACRIERNDGDHCRSAPTRQDRLECHRLRHVNARKQYSPSLAAHSADRPSHALRHPAPHARDPAPHAIPAPSATPGRTSQQELSAADERRCRRDRLRQQASQPLQIFYPRPSAFICGKLVLPSPPTRQASHTTRARPIRPSPGAPTPGPAAPFKPSRTDPLNREPVAKPAPTVPFKPSRTDPYTCECHAAAPTV